MGNKVAFDVGIALSVLLTSAQADLGKTSADTVPVIRQSLCMYRLDTSLPELDRNMLPLGDRRFGPPRWPEGSLGPDGALKSLSALSISLSILPTSKGVTARVLSCKV